MLVQGYCLVSWPIQCAFRDKFGTLSALQGVKRVA